MKKGFTLVEILVSLSILAIIVVMGTNMFLTTLKGVKKTKALTEVKQNGNYALSAMERTIRNAQSIEKNSDDETCASEMAKINIKNLDNNLIEFACDGSKISSNSAALTSNDVKVVAGSCFFDCQSGEAGVSPATITIRFSLSQAGEDVRPEEEALVDFQTKVTLRNY